ncbi:hypothetical protein [Polaromonas sp. C04]|uniref:hypothetical protein n=1 Tax=Polaromonas sp. C04 TaxID=1945857 RepID=UPI000984BC17|nr:hypothetical protein [Polaromonas sp. C04]OOG58067.1 hypothetical protein B0E49_04355 [Polaromonas sp. C04]
MHIKKRGTRAMLYRSHWVAKGTTGNTHGYAVQTFAGSVPLDAETLPAGLKDKFSIEETEFLESKLFQPARLAANQKRRAVELREADPVWRLEEAERLTREAAHRSERGLVPDAKVRAVQSALSAVKTIAQAQTQPRTQVMVAEQPKSDPLRDALIAIKSARDAVSAGRYGSAPAEGVRSTYPYKLWAEIFETVGGSESDSLMRALQGRGFAKTRGK